jgi:hypothetical protein
MGALCPGNQFHKHFPGHGYFEDLELEMPPHIAKLKGTPANVKIYGLLRNSLEKCVGP